MMRRLISFLTSVVAIPLVFAFDYGDGMDMLSETFGMIVTGISDKNISAGLVVIGLYAFYYGTVSGMVAKVGDRLPIGKVGTFGLAFLALVGTYAPSGSRALLVQRPGTVLSVGLVFLILSFFYKKGWLTGTAHESGHGFSSDSSVSDFEKERRRQEKLERKKDKLKQKEDKAQDDLEKKDVDEQKHIANMKKLGITDKEDMEAYRQLEQKIEDAKRELEGLLAQHKTMGESMKGMPENHPDLGRLRMQHDHMAHRIHLLENSIIVYTRQMEDIIRRYEQNISAEERETDAILKDAHAKEEDALQEEAQEVREGHVDHAEGGTASEEGEHIHTLEAIKQDEDVIEDAAGKLEHVEDAQLKELRELDAKLARINEAIEGLTLLNLDDANEAQMFAKLAEEEDAIVEAKRKLERAEDIKQKGENVLDFEKHKEQKERGMPNTKAA